MTHDNSDLDKEEQASPADRGIPSVARQPRGQIAFMAGFLFLALLAIIFVVIDGAKKSTGQSIITPEEITFKSPGSTAGPYIEAQSVNTGPEKTRATVSEKPSGDPLAKQKELLMQQEALRMARERQSHMEKRISSPQLVLDQSDSNFPSGQAGGLGENTQFADGREGAENGVQTTKAVQLHNLPALIPQGTIISGVLETTIQSDLPGMVRAVVARNVYSFDGSSLLIPKGARLIGNYHSGLVRGQSRVFVIWSRLIRGDGVSINIDSQGADTLGRAGLKGYTDTHFFERFGSSVLLSLIDSSLQAGVRSVGNANTASVALSTGDDFSKSAEIALKNSVAIPPPVHIDQGTRINVFVGQDLDFSQITKKGKEN